MAPARAFELERGTKRGDGARRVADRFVDAAQFLERDRGARELRRLPHVAIVKRRGACADDVGELRVFLVVAIEVHEMLGRSHVERIALERGLEEFDPAAFVTELQFHARGFGQPKTRRGVLIRALRGADEQRRVRLRVLAEGFIAGDQRTLIVWLIQ